MDVSLLAWVLVVAAILAMLAVDLFLHRDAHVIGVREAALWSALWVSVGVVAGVTVWLAYGAQAGQEYFAGYLIEKSLAVDNVFVWAIIFSYFAVPRQYQHRVLFYGIIGALVFRALFIAIGSVLMQYWFVVAVFGVLLIVTGVKMYFAPDQKVNPDQNVLVRLFRRWMPVTDELHGQRFFVRLNGRWHGTPLLVALLFLEMSDIIFAVDSVPAIFAISREPLIVFTSNVFAILGLRAMYFLLAGAVERFHMLKYALATILIFVGLKMVWLNEAFGGKFPIEWSLGIIGALLAAGVVGSLLTPHRRAGAQS